MSVKDILTITDSAEFLRQSEEFLRGEIELDEFKLLFQRLVSIDARHAISDAGVDTTSICELIRELLFQLTIDAGNLPEIADLVVFNLFINAKNLGSHPKAATTIAGLQEVFDADTLSELEKVYMVILEFYLGILDGRANEALGIFVRRLCIVHLHEVMSVVNSDTIVSLFTAVEVSAKDFMVFLEPLFEPQFYFSLKHCQRRSIFDWILHSYWQYQPLFSHAGWPQFYENWKRLLYEHIARDECDEVMYLQFFIYHVMGNSYQTHMEWREFNNSISRKTSEYYIDWANRHGMEACKPCFSLFAFKPTPSNVNNIKTIEIDKQTDGRQVIGFLRDRLVKNAPFQVEWSVLNSLMKDVEFKSKYRVIIYNMYLIEKSDSDPEARKMYTDIGVQVVDPASHLHLQGFYYSHLEKALLIRDRILDDGADILISPNNGYGVSDFLVSTRVAPKQIFWVHGNFEYDIPNIDKRITHIPANTHQKQSDYIVEHFEYQTDEMFTKPEEEKNKALAGYVRARFSEDTVILGAIGRLVKLNNYEYLGAVAEIMKQCPNTVYLACGGGNIESVREKAIEVGMPMDRFFFEGFVDPHIYGYVIDVYLNTFPEMSGESLVEFLSKSADKYAVSLES